MLHFVKKMGENKFVPILKEVKVPQKYSSNFKSIAFVQNIRLAGLKFHDCHVLMQ